MRLLRLEEDGGFRLVEFVGKSTPRYAIISHTWGADDEEVTFKDLIDGTGKTKAGYRKIHFCGMQAANDSLQFFWVDTCCIDKSSSTELSEAINSMFRWYHDAAKCYVYLSDVSVGGSDLFSQQTWKPAFQHSRWFTRGWTLQELLAPTCVDFFSVEGERLGDKISLVQEIHGITGIPIQALQGRPLSEFSVDERMSWAEKRETRREEDAAYSLLGILDIYMSLIYGEGRNRALRRLRKEIKEYLKDESPALPPTPPTEQPKRKHEPPSAAPPSKDPDLVELSSYKKHHGNDGGVRGSQHNVVCSKCLYFRYLTKNGKGRADHQTLGHRPGHHANSSHCPKIKNQSGIRNLFGASSSKVNDNSDDWDFVERTLSSTESMHSVDAMPMWPGNIIRTGFSRYYLHERDRMSDAAYYGKWDEVLELLEVARDEHGENWANVVHLSEKTIWTLKVAHLP